MHTGRCPKCDGSRVATTSYTLYLGGGVSGPSIHLYACADCRYVEQYLADSVEARVSVLDSWRWVFPDEGPFR
jgi:predicted nucleic-acid-binding Zn-ribbon protein